MEKANIPNQDDTFTETENSSSSSYDDDNMLNERPLDDEDGEGHLPTESKSMIDIPQEGVTFIAPEIGKNEDEKKHDHSSSDDELDRSKL